MHCCNQHVRWRRGRTWWARARTDSGREGTGLTYGLTDSLTDSLSDSLTGSLPDSLTK